MKYPFYIILSLVMGYIVGTCHRQDPIVETVTREVIVPGDTVFKETLVPDIQERIVYRERVRIDTVFDTITVIQDYFTKYAYRDTVEQSEVTVIISDTLLANRIQNRSVAIRNNREKQITYHTTTIMDPKRVFSGGLIGGSNELTPALLYTDKRNNSFMAGYDVVNQEIKAGIFFKIR